MDRRTGAKLLTVLGVLFVLSVMLRNGMLGHPTALASPSGLNDALWDVLAGEPMDTSTAQPGLQCAPDVLARLGRPGGQRDQLGPCVADGWDRDYLSAYGATVELFGGQPAPRR